MVVKTIFSCQNCGCQSPKWLGRCPECGKWNSFLEEEAGPGAGEPRQAVGGIIFSSSPQKLSEIKSEDFLRISTNIDELDRVLGGGLVEGESVLIGGEPGIGKSTLMLQMSDIISKTRKVLYVSGEESLSQIKLRARRIGASSNDLYFVNETDLASIIKYMKELKPELTIVDSIQTVCNAELTQSAGTVSQIRESAALLTSAAKSLGIAVFMIGHITKEGFIAGPKVLEHIVDAVIYFEGQRQSSFRLLRAIKNRFGATDEIGIFSMGEKGLLEVKDPSGIFLSQRQKLLPGTCITAVMEGTRPLLVEVQALVSSSNFGMPRQRSMGFDFNRMALLLAVLEKSAGLNMPSHDVFLNVAGGVEINEPGADLAACIAITSSFKNKPLRQDTVVIGEIGLTSEVRGISHFGARINEAQRLGFKRCIVPACDAKSIGSASKIELIGVNNLQEAIDKAL